MKTVNFLDVTFNLLTGKHQPYRKDGNPPLFVSPKSNHPPSILKQLPIAIGYRISEFSSDKDEFEFGACLTKSIVYMAEVTTQIREQKQYIGMTENDFKGRYNMHKQPFNKPKHENSTSPSKYIWELKRADINYDIKWSILKRAKAYVAGSRSCN